MRGNQKGFTLIELMIVVAILSLLAAIAYPTYVGQMRKSRRAECETVLLSYAGALERQYAANGSYADTTNPPRWCPLDGSGSTQYYTIAAPTGLPNTFTLTATPVGDQINDSCGSLSITHTGKKGQSSGTVDQCWR
jgi:type IV pilus assembly protein PilE